ncbi:MAG: translation initiation factor IF-2 [Sulfobacillus thermosulfidooxidans]|nr:MAG: translation initiation factor IF-2 [Sulfobacillus thermosulfidooxidans]
MTEKEKVRVYELAKEVKLDSRRLIDLLHRLHVENIKNHMSTVEPEAVQTVKNIMEGKLPPEPKSQEPAVSEPVRKTEPTPSVPAHSEGPTVAGTPLVSSSHDEKNHVSTSAKPMANGARPDNRSPRPTNGRDNRPYPPREGANGRSAASASSNRPASASTSRPQTSYNAGGTRTGGAGYNGGNRPAGGGERRGPGPSRPSGPRPQGSGYNGPGPRPSGRPGGAPAGASSNRSGGTGPRPASRAIGAPLAAPPTRPAREQNRRGAYNKDRRTTPAMSSGRRKNAWEDENYGSKHRSKSQKNQVKQQETVMPPVQRHIIISSAIMVKDLADQLGVKATELIKRLIGLGVMAGVNQELDRETAVIIATEFGATVEERATQEEQEEIILQGEDDSPESLTERPPVVTVMGHVDHGKTSLLDRIRATRVTQSEAGGITQHIGASVIEWNDRKVVFLDTPGHEAFTSMRARGAQVTDVAVLVVAANDGVMPQTVEAINHAKAANVPIVVAINKIDLPGANPDKVRTELSNYGLIAEEWGGDTIMVPVSARTGEGIENLLEALILQADVLELKANSQRAAQGTIIEAKLDKGRGPVATVLVSRGMLNVGDVFVAGAVYGRVRALINDRGQRVKSAGPSMPVEVLGFNQLPEAGDDFVILADERQAKSIADSRQDRIRRQSEPNARGVSLDDFLQRLKDEAVKELNLVIKADVHGSAEALAQSVSKLSNDEVRVRVLHAGVGSITETDVMLAQASNAIIVGFGVGVENKARQIAEKEHVDIRSYRVIYDAIDDINKALRGMLEPKFQEVILGRAEVREVFRVPKIGAIGGCYVTDGKILRSGKVRVLRDGAVIHEGNIASLKRFKDDVREVATGFECGIGLEKFNDIKVGDIFEAFSEEEVKAS